MPNFVVGKGVAMSGATSGPGARNGLNCWWSSNSFYYFGGQTADGQVRSDVWSYSPSMDTFLWKHGSNTTGQNQLAQKAVYEPKGVPTAEALPYP
jgi:hypothetical protein